MEDVDKCFLHSLIYEFSLLSYLFEEGSGQNNWSFADCFLEEKILRLFFEFFTEMNLYWHFELARKYTTHNYFSYEKIKIN